MSSGRLARGNASVGYYKANRLTRPCVPFRFSSLSSRPFSLLPSWPALSWFLCCSFVLYSWLFPCLIITTVQEKTRSYRKLPVGGAVFSSPIKLCAPNTPLGVSGQGRNRTTDTRIFSRQLDRLGLCISMSYRGVRCPICITMQDCAQPIHAKLTRTGSLSGSGTY